MCEWLEKSLYNFCRPSLLNFLQAFIENNNAAFRCHYCQEPRERLQRSNDVIITQNGADRKGLFFGRCCVFFSLALLQK